MWFAKTSAGTRNGAVLGGVGLNAIIVSIQHGDTGGQEPERVERTSMRRFTLSPFYQLFSKSEFAKNLPKARAGGRTVRLLSSTALSSIHTRLILRACDPNPRVLRETSREI